MSSIVQGYAYDIFISYRQKDNKHDGWVTEFVDNLKGELESTFKEEISVYYDINPHDGLLETHDVDASLKEKLKCLIFIPIISRTYCDPKSFAWEHEFKAFVEQSSKDMYGLKVKLAGGNVANRVLPVMIHDLDDPEDKKLVENELGGFIRGIDFIYKEPGINKPLKPDDDEKKNLNKTKYSYQINKVANAVREIINGLKSDSFAGMEQRTKNIETLHQNPPIDRQKSKRDFFRIRLKTSILVMVTLLIVVIALWLVFFRNNTPAVKNPLEKRLSIAVMPFRNMTMDSVWNVWQEGIQISLITALSNTGEFNVRQVESTSGLIRARGIADYTSLTPSLASSLSVTLDAELFIYGTINKAGPTIRLVGQLIDSKSQEIDKTFELDIPGGEKMIMPMVDSFGQSIADYLFLENLGRKDLPDIRSKSNTKSPEAYKSYINGQNAFYNQDFKTAIGMFLHAAEIDSSFWVDIFFISLSYNMVGLNNEAGFWYNKLESKRSYFKGNLIYNNWIDWLKGQIYGLPYEGIKALRQLQKYDNQSPITSYSIGHNYMLLDQYENAIPDLELALELYGKWGIKPAWVYNYRDLIVAYHETGQYRKEKELFIPAEKDFPNDPLLIERKIIYFINTRDKEEAEKQISRFKTVCMEEGLSEASVISWIGNLLYGSKQVKQAEEYYLRALSLEAGNPEVINNYANFLIDSEKDIKRGLELNSKAIELDPENCSILETKGWGLYKLGNYKEAVKYLEKSWERKTNYNQPIKNKLDAAQKALTEHQDKL